WGFVPAGAARAGAYPVARAGAEEPRRRQSGIALPDDTRRRFDAAGARRRAGAGATLLSDPGHRERRALARVYLSARRRKRAMQHAHIGRRTLAVALLCGLGAGAAAAETGSAPLQIGSAQLAGDEASYLDLGLGSFGSGAGHLAPQSAEGRIELRYGRKLFQLGPALGLLANTKGGVFGYG